MNEHFVVKRSMHKCAYAGVVLVLSTLWSAPRLALLQLECGNVRSKLCITAVYIPITSGSQLLQQERSNSMIRFGWYSPDICNNLRRLSRQDV